MEKTTKIFLVGFMGSGKSTLGKKLAQKLNMSFLDLDQQIEENEGITISEIFEKHGESYFRTLETNLLKETIEHKDNFILSLGGGTPCFYNNMEFINKNGISIYLKYNSGILTSRLLTAKQQRPLIASKNEDELKKFVEELLAKRVPFYNQSQLIVEGNNITAKEIISKL